LYFSFVYFNFYFSLTLKPYLSKSLKVNVTVLVVLVVLILIVMLILEIIRLQ